MTEDVNKIAKICRVIIDKYDIVNFESINNFWMNNMVYLCSAYGRGNIKINMIPMKFKISENKSSDIKETLKNNINNLKKIENDLSNYDKYLEIYYIDGEKQCYIYEDFLDNIYDLSESKINENAYIVEPPYLQLDNEKIVEELHKLKNICGLINEKNTKEIFKLLNNNCELEYEFENDTKKVEGKTKIIKECKKYTGIFNHKISKTKFETNIIGLLDKDKKSVIGIKVNILDEVNYEYIMLLEIGEENKIICIKLIKDTPILNKKTFGVLEMKKLENGEYNDLNEQMQEELHNC